MARKTKAIVETFPVYKFSIQDAGITFEFAETGTRVPERPVFFVGVAKSGSTLMHRIVEDMCRTLNDRLINISDTCFVAGVPERKIPDAVLPGLPDTRPAYYYGFRCIGNLTKSVAFRTSPKIYLIRDPRDAATSLFFSMQKSHSLPKSGRTAEIIKEQREKASQIGINEFILSGSADFIFTALAEIQRNLWLPESYLFRYEDIIFDKKNWIERLCAIADLRPSEKLISDLLATHDVVPNSENPDQHIRQVAPGNFRRHLSEEALNYIEKKSESYMADFGYKPVRDETPAVAAVA